MIVLFCSELKSLNTCISNNTQLKCGKEAKSLVDVLIRASIKRSTECDNLVPLSVGIEFFELDIFELVGYFIDSDCV